MEVYIVFSSPLVTPILNDLCEVFIGLICYAAYTRRRAFLQRILANALRYS